MDAGINETKNERLVIDPEFSKLIKPLADEEFRQLEENCIKYGVQDAIKTWNGTIVDGHNRYAIAKKHNLPYKTISMIFTDKEEAKYWIRNNQLGRRNLETWERFDLVKENKAYEAKLTEKNLHKATGGDRKSEKYKEERKKNIAQEAKVENQPTEILREVEDEQKQQKQKPEPVKETKKPDKHAGETSAKMAKQIGVSARTYDKMEYIDKHGTPEVNELVRKGTITTERAYQATKAKMNPAPPKPAPLREHKEYEKNKSESTGAVDFQSAKEDKENVRLIYIDFWKRMSNIRNSIRKVNGDKESGHIDFGEAQKYLDATQLKELKSSINESINILMNFAKEVSDEG